MGPRRKPWERLFGRAAVGIYKMSTQMQDQSIFAII